MDFECIRIAHNITIRAIAPSHVLSGCRELIPVTAECDSPVRIGREASGVLKEALMSAGLALIACYTGAAAPEEVDRTRLAPSNVRLQKLANRTHGGEPAINEVLLCSHTAEVLDQGFS